MADVSVVERIALSVERFPHRPALELGEQQWSYSELWNAAASIATAINNADRSSNSPVVLFASRSFATYAGILGILRAGRAYVPMNLKFPVARAQRIIHIVGATTAVVSAEFSDYYQQVNRESGHRMNAIIVGDGSDKQKYADDAVAGDALILLNDNPAKQAYILFTSGTTGEPKGIPVSHNNLAAYLAYIASVYDIGAEDRCSQAFDTTFDPSVHDIFVCWSSGACLCPLNTDDLLIPNNFIIKKNLTVWYSVPSIPLRMKQVRMLKPGVFPNLRWSFFSGEALPDHIAAAWKMAAPNSKIVNYYGPTEVTINITEHEWDSERSPGLAAHGIVPIGKVYPTHRYLIIDHLGEPVQQGNEGELIVSGAQVTEGYLNSPERTSENYIRRGSEEELWYRTGDRVIELHDGTLQFLGRIDHQIQIRGFRVEAGEVEATIRQVEGVVEAVVLPITDADGMVQGLRAFIVIGNEPNVVQRSLQRCRSVLPEYMVPSQILVLDQFPMNDNGKIDRKKLSIME